MYNQIYYSTMALDSSVFDSTRTAQLWYLASQCPITGGNAVYAARSLLALQVDTVFNDSVCMHHGEHRMEALTLTPNNTNADSLAPKLQVKMYPNPASGYAILQLSQDITPMQLQITDGLGQTILNQPVSTTNGYYTINTTSFSSGLYYVALYTSTGKIFGGKLSIITQ